MLLRPRHKGQTFRDALNSASHKYSAIHTYVCMYVWHIYVILQLEIDGARVHVNAVESFAIFVYFLKETKVKLYELALLPLHLARILPYH